jgi:hypothetical protein
MSSKPERHEVIDVASFLHREQDELERELESAELALEAEALRERISRGEALAYRAPASGTAAPPTKMEEHVLFHASRSFTPGWAPSMPDPARLLRARAAERSRRDAAAERADHERRKATAERYIALIAELEAAEAALAAIPDGDARRLHLERVARTHRDAIAEMERSA